MKKPVPMRPPRGGGFFRHILDGRARDAHSANMRHWRRQQQQPEPQPPSVEKPPTSVEKPAESTQQAEQAEKQSAPPAPAARLRPRARHAGGRPVEHKWESAAQHVDREVGIDNVDEKERRLLPRNSKGEPLKARAVDLMTEWFEKNDPPAPSRRQIYEWLKNHPRRTRRWWQPRG